MHEIEQETKARQDPILYTSRGAEMINSRNIVLITLLSLSNVSAVLPAAADPARDAILATLAEEAKKADPAFGGFSAELGQAFFAAKHTGGKPDTPSCTSCHSQDPTAAGETRAGKRIEPMAVSKNPSRFTKVDEVNKWFGRNCNSVLGRECTAVEKGDFITYLSGK
jgi:cytochrome c peroxidase